MLLPRLNMVKVLKPQTQVDNTEKMVILLLCRIAEELHKLFRSLIGSCVAGVGSHPHFVETACLEVKVIEARNLVIPFDRLRNQYTMSAFVVLTCERQGRKFSFQTNVEKNKNSPRYRCILFRATEV